MTSKKILAKTFLNKKQRKNILSLNNLVPFLGGPKSENQIQKGSKFPVAFQLQLLTFGPNSLVP